MRYRTLMLAVLLSLIFPITLLAQSDLGINESTKNKTSTDQPLQIIAVSSNNDASTLAMLDWLIYKYETVPKSEGMAMLERMLFNYETIPFEYASHKLTPVGEKILTRKAHWIKKTNTKLQITVTGHCDQRGSLEFNKHLGALRANTVKQFLLNKGIVQDQLIITSAGDLKPITREENEAGWAKNRRVEVNENQ